MRQVIFSLLLVIAASRCDAQWIPQLSGTNKSLYAVSFADVNTGAAVGDSGTILRTTDGGATWTNQSSGTNHCLWGVSFTDADNGTAVGDSGEILRTTNGGTSWSKQTSGTVKSLYSVCFTDVNTGTAVGDFGTVLRTTDGGTTWAKRASATMRRLNGVFFTDPDNGTAVGESSTIIRTTNGGVTWKRQLDGTANSLRGVCFTDLNNGAAVGAVDTMTWYPYAFILRTTNGGATWTCQMGDQDIYYNIFLYAVSFADANVGTAVGHWTVRKISAGRVPRPTNNSADPLTKSSGMMGFGGILRTTDGGATWSIYSNTINTAGLSSVCFIDANNGTMVGEGGTIFRTTNGGATWAEDQSKHEREHPTAFSLDQNYPNPFNPSTTIRYGLPEEAPVTLTVHNALGQQVAALVQGEQEAGYHEVKFDATSFSSGVYLYRLRAREFVQTKKLMVLK